MDISWAFNGEPINDEHRDQFVITKSKRLSVLQIDAVAARHAGEYTCTVSNNAGASSHMAALAVNGNARACTGMVMRVQCTLSLSLSLYPSLALSFSSSLYLSFSLFLFLAIDHD